MMACVAVALPRLAFVKDQSAQAHAGRSQHHTIHLAWHPPANSRNPVAGYNIYRSSNGGKSFSRVNALPIPKPEYDDATVRRGTTYLYVVKSVDNKGVESGPSNKIRLTVPK
jgi:fibronectin type 3 domain-containing protein